MKVLEGEHRVHLFGYCIQGRRSILGDLTPSLETDLDP